MCAMARTSSVVSHDDHRTALRAHRVHGRAKCTNASGISRCSPRARPSHCSGTSARSARARSATRAGFRRRDRCAGSEVRCRGPHGGPRAWSASPSSLKSAPLSPSLTPPRATRRFSEHRSAGEVRILERERVREPHALGEVVPPEMSSARGGDAPVAVSSSVVLPTPERPTRASAAPGALRALAGGVGSAPGQPTLRPLSSRVAGPVAPDSMVASCLLGPGEAQRGGRGRVVLHDRCGHRTHGLKCGESG